MNELLLGFMLIPHFTIYTGDTITPLQSYIWAESWGLEYTLVSFVL